MTECMLIMVIVKVGLFDVATARQVPIIAPENILFVTTYLSLVTECNRNVSDSHF